MLPSVTEQSGGCTVINHLTNQELYGFRFRASLKWAGLGPPTKSAKFFRRTIQGRPRWDIWKDDPAWGWWYISIQAYQASGTNSLSTLPASCQLMHDSSNTPRRNRISPCNGLCGLLKSNQRTTVYIYIYIYWWQTTSTTSYQKHIPPKIISPFRWNLCPLSCNNLHSTWVVMRSLCLIFLKHYMFSLLIPIFTVLLQCKIKKQKIYVYILQKYGGHVYIYWGWVKEELFTSFSCMYKRN
jgi:hypothetical protein